MLFTPGLALADRTAVSVKGSTLGLGIELDALLPDSMSGRIGINAYDYKKKVSNNSIDYDMNLKLQTVEAMADYYPYLGAFRMTAGLLYNHNRGDFTALPDASGNYSINGNTYTSAQVGSLQGSMTFNRVAPYLGIGWGNPVARDKSLGLAADVGILYQGVPTATLATTSTDPGVRSSVASEQTKFQKSVNNFRYYPVISIALTYQW